MSEINHIDYVGFTFNGIHSSELGIKRTSDGSRFNENLLPTIQDKTTQVPGGDGMYHFGSYYTQRQFNIPYAFDALTEEQLARIKAVFGDKKIHEIIFDEAPYKAYQVKVTGSAQIKYIPFAEGKTNRVYKGEGSVQFTAFNPYARSVKKFLDEYNESNKQEWKDAARLINSDQGYDKLQAGSNIVKLYNPGVKETDCIITLNFINNIIPAGEIQIKDGDSVSSIFLEEMTRQGQDTCIKINSKLNLIEGYNGSIKSGKLYNKNITGGSFFKIPCSFDLNNLNTVKDVRLVINSSALKDNFQSIEYDYIYL